MALSSPAMSALADWCWQEHLREMEESSESWKMLFECIDKVKAGEMSEEIVWSDDGDLSYVFTPTVTKDPA